MDERQRRLLQRNRLRLVTELRVGELWQPLRARGLFSADMIEDILRAGTRRDQARQLIIDLQTRGSHAFPMFVACLEETGHTDLARLLCEGCLKQTLDPVPILPVQIPILPPKSQPEPENEFFHHRRAGPGETAGPEETAGPGETSEQRETPQRVREIRGSGDVIEGDPRNNSAKAYILESDPCGFCLIINNVTFLEHANLSTRVGSDIDCEKLQQRFQSFHFDVLVRNNLKAKEILNELQSLAAKDHSRLDCCVVVILSHGCEARHIQLPGGVYGVDGVPVPVERVVTYLDGRNCPTLRGKPKLFFIQACGGAGRDKGFKVESEASDSVDQGPSMQSDASPFSTPSGGHDQPDAVSSLPTPSDVLVSYSTYPGFVSWRDHKVGTWYVETLDKVFAENAASEDLQNLLVMVSNEVADKGTYKQMPGYFNFLRKRFFFNTT